MLLSSQSIDRSLQNRNTYSEGENSITLVFKTAGMDKFPGLPYICLTGTAEKAGTYKGAYAKKKG
jgi:hypothetical protein